MSNYIDADIFANISSKGGIRTYSNEGALKNALRMFITSKKGDIIYEPEEGGAMDIALFRNIEVNRNKILFQLRNSILNFFEPEITLLNIDVTPDYEKKIIEISINYTNNLTNITDSLVVYTRDLSQVRTFTYVDVDLVGDNAYNFVLTQLTNQADEKLTYNADLGKYLWGKYKFTNSSFGPMDSRWSDILGLINN